MAKRCKVTVAVARSSYAFTAVDILCGRLSRVGDLSHVSGTINSFLDQITTQCWTLESAIARGVVPLLDSLAVEEWFGVPQCFREQRFDYSIASAASEGYVAVLDW